MARETTRETRWEWTRARRIPLGALLAAGGFGIAALGHVLWHGLRTADLHGQVALITGGSRGLGLALAEEFARQSCKLVICSRDQDELDAARRILAGRGADVLVVRADVADREDVTRLLRAATERYGQIDILVNVAGI